jgi:hypothetical protein
MQKGQLTVAQRITLKIEREQRQTNAARSAPLKFVQAFDFAMELKFTLASIGISLNLARFSIRLARASLCIARAFNIETRPSGLGTGI